MLEPTHWPSGAKYFGHYAFGHKMTERPGVKIVRKRIAKNIHVLLREIIPVRCTRCHLRIGDIALMHECATTPTPIADHQTSIGLDRELVSEHRARELVLNIKKGSWREMGV